MAEDRFANVFTAKTVMTAANTLTFNEMVFGITLRDRIAIVIDELYFLPFKAAIAEMTALSDSITMCLSSSDQPTDISDLNDRRILFSKMLSRHDFGTAAGGSFLIRPLKESFAPPMIALPNRLFFGVDTAGLASAATAVLRMHFRTVTITQDQQLIEVLETFQLST